MKKELTSEELTACNVAECHGFIQQRMFDGTATNVKRASATGKPVAPMTPEQALQDLKKANSLIAAQQAKIATVQAIVREQLKPAAAKA